MFEPSRQVFGVVAEAGGAGFVALGDAGFAASPMLEWQEPLFPGEPEEERNPTRWRAFDLTSDIAAREVLIWSAIASEMAVSPRAPIYSYLADFDRGITLYVYDDRGMDLAALEPEPLRTLYAARNEWLLDHDRQRMKAAFE